MKILYKSKLGYTYKGFDGEISPVKHNESIYQSTIQATNSFIQPIRDHSTMLNVGMMNMSLSSYKPRYKALNLTNFEPKNYAKTK